MLSSGMWHCIDLVWSDISEERITTCSRWFLFHGFFYPEDGGDTFLRNVGSYKIYTAPHPRGLHSSVVKLTLRKLLMLKCVPPKLSLCIIIAKLRPVHVNLLQCLNSCLHQYGINVAWFYMTWQPSTLNVDAACSFKTSVLTSKTVQCQPKEPQSV
jgi:hypothetical protein